MDARELTVALGGRWHGSYGTVRCPAHEDRSPSLSIQDGEKATLFKCHAGCESAHVVSALRGIGLWDGERVFPQSVEKPRKADDNRRRRQLASDIWQQTVVPIAGTATEAYLRSRFISIRLPDSIRHHPGLSHGPTGKTLPAMVCKVVDSQGKGIGIHRTFLNGANKAEVSPKMALGPIAGGSVRLAPVTDCVALAEGVEDALSIIEMTGAPAWAVLGTAGFSNFDPPAGLKRVILAPDADDAGEASIDRAGRRLTGLGLRVEIARPPLGKDFNDSLAQFAERAAIAHFDGQQSIAAAYDTAWAEVFA